VSEVYISETQNSRHVAPPVFLDEPVVQKKQQLALLLQREVEEARGE
jgi:hypothetical protein